MTASTFIRQDFTSQAHVAHVLFVGRACIRMQKAYRDIDHIYAFHKVSIYDIEIKMGKICLVMCLHLLPFAVKAARKH